MDKLPFIPDHIYHRRSEIHRVYGGNWQGGICPSGSFPYIFIFTGNSGQQHGYQDGWDNPAIFTYTGEGQDGDMNFMRGNLALKDHKENGKRVFLFEFFKRGYVKFNSEVEVQDIDFDTKDFNGKDRRIIKFFFKKTGVSLPEYLIKSIKPPAISDFHYVNYKDYILPNSTERSGLVTSRVGQGGYRKRIIYRWDGKCAVTGFTDNRILIASHIVPWAESDDHERLDVNNGILLSPNYDALFDKHLISFENSGKIILSDSIEYSEFKRIGVTGQEKIIKPLSRDNFIYLERHRERMVF